MEIKSIKKPFLLLPGLMLIPFSLWARNYYVSTAGNNATAGTKRHPFGHIQKAASLMQPGDTCFIFQGIYREAVKPAHSGIKNKPLVFTGYKKDRVVIMGTKRISGWVPYKNGIYKKCVPKKIFQLFVNGQRAMMARFPDKKDDSLFSVSDWASVTAYPDGKVIFNGMRKPKGYWSGGICRILTGKHWIAHIGRISDSQGREVTCDRRSKPWGDYNPSIYLGKGLGCIYHLRALDHPNEWYWQKDTLYYYPKRGFDPEKMVAEARTRINGFDLCVKKYVEIRNLNFVMASVNMEQAEGCVLERCHVFYPVPFFKYRNGWCRDMSVGSDYSIRQWEGKGVAVSGTGNSIRHCYVGYSWGDGISIGGQGNRVENCLVENCDLAAIDAAAISATGTGHLISHCTLRNAARSILLHRFCNHTNIVYNDISNSGWMCEDLGLTYAYHTNGQGSEIAYNKVHDNHARSTASGIYLDNYDTSYVVHHNVIWNVTYAIQTNKPAVGHKIVNNTVWHCKYAMWAWGREGTEVIDQLVTNNLSDKPWDVGTVFHNNLTTKIPEFVDPEHGDFCLKKNSPAIDAGVVVPGITGNYNGKAPDAGAYEYGIIPWKAGSDVVAPELGKLIRL